MDRQSSEQEPFIYKDADTDEELQILRNQVSELKSGNKKFNPGTHSHGHRSKRPSPIAIAVIISAIASVMLTLTVQSLYIAFVENKPSTGYEFALPGLNVTECMIKNSLPTFS